MAEYIDREEFLKRIKPYDTPDKMDKALYNFALNQMIETPTADVVERAEYDKMVQSFQGRNENLKQNLINTRDSYLKLEKEITELEVKIDKAIEDIKNIDLIVHDGINHYYKSGEEVKAEVLVILKLFLKET